jgi:predicted DNA binding CopG/RHH family protein
MMKKKNNIFNVKLDLEEQELLESIERGEWKTVENFEEEAAFAKKAAANTLRKPKTESSL